MMVKKLSLVGVSCMCVLSLCLLFLPQQTSALSVKLTISGTCGSTFCIGQPVQNQIELSEGAYVDVWVETATRTSYLVQNQYLGAGLHEFCGTVGDPEGTHTAYVEATNVAGVKAQDSCSYYVVRCGSSPVPPQPTSQPSSDSDGDGVSDSSDQCYNPNCDPVDSQGCPRDSDSDGVFDCDDRCTYEKGPASNSGCPEDYSTSLLKYWWVIVVLIVALGGIIYLNHKRPPKLKM
ncbi:MAG: hypothetical protein WBA22_09030 [Candidatus Methanofastidiosia archaeon]